MNKNLNKAIKYRQWALQSIRQGELIKANEFNHLADKSCIDLNISELAEYRKEVNTLATRDFLNYLGVE